MKDNYVLDTNSLISYFRDIFKVSSTISQQALNIIDDAFNNSKYKIIIPSIVFIELFKKWYKDEEFLAKIRYDIFQFLRDKENIAILGIDREVLENLILLNNIQFNFDNHDKLILATAMVYQYSLISSDGRIAAYNNTNKVIPAIIS